MTDGHDLHYGFFGLTALGPTSTFAQGAMLAMGVSEFTDEEWETGFNKFDADNSGELDPNELYNLLYHVYHGPPPKFASEGFIGRFDTNRDGTIQPEELKKVPGTHASRHGSEQHQDLLQGSKAGQCVQGMGFQRHDCHCQRPP